MFKKFSKRLARVFRAILPPRSERKESRPQLYRSGTAPASENACRKNRNKDTKTRLVEKPDLPGAAYAYQEPIFHVHAADCLSRAGISYRSESAEHPFVRSLCDFAENRRPDRMWPILHAWFSEWCPTSFAELFGTASGSELATVNPDSMRIEFRLPWESNDKISHLTPLYGPVSDDTIEYEVKRLIDVFVSIEQHGYQPEEFGDEIRGLLLADQARYRFIVKGGQHRIAALVALGHKTIRVRFQPGWPRMIARQHVKHWPQVRSSSITADDAVNIFDAFMDRSNLASGKPVQQ